MGSQLSSKNGRPIIDCDIKLVSEQGETVWFTKTDNTGKAELWANIYSINSENKNNYSIQINHNNKNHNIAEPTRFHEGINHFEIETECNIPDNINIALLKIIHQVSILFNT